MDGNTLLERWMLKNDANNFDGARGLRTFEKLLKHLNYENSGLRFGSVIESFLNDNPGAVESLLDFISDQLDDNPEWREALAEHADVKNVDADDEDCPACGAEPGSGPTDDCDDDDGCGYWRELAEGREAEKNDP